MKVLITNPLVNFKQLNHYSKHFNNKFLKKVVFCITKYPIELNNYICNLGGIKYIKVQDHDIGDFNVTLSKIILQGLIKIKDQKKGSPIIDNCEGDFPEDVKCKSCEDMWHIEDDCKLHDRWNYILDEMIFVFEKKSSGLYYTDEDLVRINRGLEYFGKFYSALY